VTNHQQGVQVTLCQCMRDMKAQSSGSGFVVN